MAEKPGFTGVYTNVTAQIDVGLTPQGVFVGSTDKIHAMVNPARRLIDRLPAGTPKNDYLPRIKEFADMLGFLMNDFGRTPEGERFTIPTLSALPLRRDYGHVVYPITHPALAAGECYRAAVGSAQELNHYLCLTEAEVEKMNQDVAEINRKRPKPEHHLKPDITLERFREIDGYLTLSKQMMEIRIWQELSDLRGSFSARAMGLEIDSAQSMDMITRLSEVARIAANMARKEKGQRGAP